VGLGADPRSPGLRRRVVAVRCPACAAEQRPERLWGCRTRRPGLLCGSLVFVDEAAEDRLALDPFLGEIGYGVVRPGWLELERAVRSSPVVVPGILGHHDTQVSLAENQHPVGDLGRAVSTNRCA